MDTKQYTFGTTTNARTGIVHLAGYIGEARTDRRGNVIGTQVCNTQGGKAMAELDLDALTCAKCQRFAAKAGL